MYFGWIRMGIGGLIVMTLVSCSLWDRLQESKVGKWTEDLTAHYNIYFNAYEKWQEARHRMEQEVRPDYRTLMPLLIIPDSARTTRIKSDMGAVIQKARKIIKDKSRSQWVDDAYVLMGVAYLYRADPLTALQMFQYVKNHYKKSPSAVAAHLWIVMTYLQMGQVEKADAYLDLLKERQIPMRHRSFYWKLKAQIALMKQEYATALKWVRKVAKTNQQRPDRLRTFFVWGQILERLGAYNKAISVFRNLIRRYPHYDYIFNSKMHILRCQSKQHRRTGEVEKALLRLARDERNKDYLDRIYLELGIQAMHEGNIQKMRTYMAKAAHHSKDGNIRATAFHHLARYYYTQNAFGLAAHYYDSTHAVMTPSFAHYEEVRQRRPILKELIQYLEIIRKEDSLLALAELPSDVLLQRIRMQIQAQRKARKVLQKTQQRRNSESEIPTLSPMQRIRYLDKIRAQQQQSQGNKWYFYNALARGVGYNDFIRQWVGVKDGDFWAINALRQQQDADEVVTNQTSDATASDTTYHAPPTPALRTLPPQLASATDEEKAFLLQLPLDSASKVATHHRIAQALLKSAILYLEILESPWQAIAQLDSLLARYPSSPLAPAAHYYLARAHEKAGNTNMAQYHRTRLAQEYPESVYTRLLNRRLRAIIQQAQIGAEQKYKALWHAYQRGQCRQVEELAPTIDTQYLDPNTQTGILLMVEVCRLRGLPIDSLVNRLTAFVQTYPGTDAVVMAQRLIQAYQQRQIAEIAAHHDSIRQAKLKKYPYQIDYNGPFFNIVVLPTNALAPSEASQHLANVNLIMYGGEKSLRIVPVALSEDTTLLLVKPFFTHSEAHDYYQQLSTQTRFFHKLKLNSPIFFYITQSNFKVLLRTNNISEYFEFFKKTYLENTAQNN